MSVLSGARSGWMLGCALAAMVVAGAGILAPEVAGAFPATMQLASLKPENGGNGTVGVVFNSALGLQSGNALSNVRVVGDINGDGIADIAMGVPQYDNPNVSTGVVFVVFGASGWPARFDLGTLDGTNGFRLDPGTQINDLYLGRLLAPGGDVNADGRQDLLLASQQRAYAVFGHAPGDPAFAAEITLPALDGTDGFLITAPAGSGYNSITGLDTGDTDGDGVSDVVAADQYYPLFTAPVGAIFSVYGHADPFGSQFSLDGVDGTNGFRMDGAAANQAFGGMLSSSSDLSGDGLTDFVTVDNYGAEGVIVFGTPGPHPASFTIPTLDGTNGFRFVGNGLSNFNVASGGDINADGKPDMMFCEGTISPGHSFPGRSCYVVFGSATGYPATLTPAQLDGTNGFTYQAEPYASKTGAQAAMVGDINNDGYDDLAIGTATFLLPSGGNRTLVHVIFGSPNGFPATLDQTYLDGVHGFLIDALSTGAYVTGVSGGGDVNGDGVDDLVVSTSSSSEGSIGDFVYVVYGKGDVIFQNGFDAPN